MIKIHESMIQLKVSDGTQMAAFVAKPDGAIQGGILVFQEAFGVNNHIENIARRLAREGYVAIAPELFHRTAPVGFEEAYDNYQALKPHFDALSDETLMADAKAAYEWFRNEAGLKANSIGCVGFCMGGRVAFMANAVLPVRAAVSFYGSRILTQSLPLAKDQKAPLLLLWGGKDKAAPPEKIKELTDSLKEAGKDFINAEFSEAGHGFNCDDRSDYHPASADTAWAMTLAFFKRHLGLA